MFNQWGQELMSQQPASTPAHPEEHEDVFHDPYPGFVPRFVPGASPLVHYVDDDLHESAPTAAPAAAAGTKEEASKQRADAGSVDQPRKGSPVSGTTASPWRFAPEQLMFSNAGERTTVRLSNSSDSDQTIVNWQLVGDNASFFVGVTQGIVIPAHEAIEFSIGFQSTSDAPQAAALLVSADGEPGIGAAPPPARLNLGGMKRGNANIKMDDNGTCGVPISPTSRGGKPNSISSAMQSVGAAWQAVIQQQIAGVQMIQGLAQKDIPPAPPRAWEVILDGALGSGLVLAFDAVTMYLGGGLALAAWDGLVARGMANAPEIAKSIANATLKLHNAAHSGVGAGIAKSIVAKIHEVGASVPMDSVVRDAFFRSQIQALSAAGSDAVTELDNNEGDFAALEEQQPGLGFIALEAYRNHLACNAAAAAKIQSEKTLGMWLDVLASLKLGTHKPERWEKAQVGADLHDDIYKRKVHPVDGVLHLEVEWNWDDRAIGPADIKSAKVSGVHSDLKAQLTTAPIGHFPLPIIANGNVFFKTEEGFGKASELRISRNAGGAVLFAAQENKKSGQMLKSVGNGDAFAGARALFARIDEMQLSKVD